MLTIEDDGGGDATRIAAAGGQGIAGMRERVAAFGGEFSIRQWSPGSSRRGDHSAGAGGMTQPTGQGISRSRG